LVDLTVLEGFLNCLRLTVKRMALYPEGHPALQTFLLDLNQKAENLIATSGRVWIGVGPRSLRLEDGAWLKEKIHEEIARLLHGRRIQSLEIQKGTTPEELGVFSRLLSSSPRELGKQKSLQKLLEEKGVTHIRVQALDYSPLLSAEGEVVKDAWAYLLEEALRRREPKEVSEAAQSMVKALDYFSWKELSSEEKQWPQWSAFFSLLKEKDRRAFGAVLRATVKNIFQQPEQLDSPAQEEKLASLLAEVDEENLAAALVEGLREDPSFDASKLFLWSRLTRTKKHGLMATFLERSLEVKIAQWPSTWLRDKLTALVQGYSVNPFPVPYYQSFLNILNKIPKEAKLQLRRDNLWRHEVSLELLFLEQETQPEVILNHFEALARNLSRVMESRDFLLLKEIHRLLVKRRSILIAHEDYAATLRRLTSFIEELILNEESFPEQDYFLKNLEASALGVNYYLEKIFGEGHISPAILSLFFQFFLNHMFYFDLNLDEKSKDRDFLEKMVESLAAVDTPASFVALKNIFLLADTKLRRRVLLALTKLSTFEPNFLWPHFLARPLSWQREALLWLRRKPEELEKALQMLLGLPSPFGLRNKLLLEAAKMTEEIGLKEAVPYLRPLAKRPFFWNRRLRQGVKRVLESLNER